MKKAQLQQVFTFIIVAIVIATTLFFAIRMMGVIVGSSCEAQVTSLSERLQELSVSYSSRGTVQEARLQAACGSQTICYFPYTQTNSQGPIAGVPTGIQAQLQSSAALGAGDNRAPANVFLVEDNTIRELGLFERIITQDNAVVCTQQQGGRFSLLFEGDGRSVKVSSLN